jgi:dihydrolipoamide dehydrogenase
LSGGIAGLAKLRGVEIRHGRGYFEDSNTLRVESEEGQRFIGFEQAIVAVGSQAAMPKAFDLGNPRIMTSNEALEVQEVPERMLVVGGGYIGLELGTVYATLGSQVVIVELMESLLYGADADLVRPVLHYAEKHFSEVRLKAKVLDMATSGKQIKVKMELEGRVLEELYDRVLVAVGRTPNCHDIGLEHTKVTRDEKGFIKVNDRQQTEDPSIYAIGDIVGGVMLAHKASREGRIAVEAITGHYSGPDKFIVPAVVFTDPEVAWCGLTEAEARQRNTRVEVAKFSWGASGRALTFDRPEGLTKMIIDPETERILGVGIVGAGAGELIAEGGGGHRDGGNREGHCAFGAPASDLVGDPHGMRGGVLRSCDPHAGAQTGAGRDGLRERVGRGLGAVSLGEFTFRQARRGRTRVDRPGVRRSARGRGGRGWR